MSELTITIRFQNPREAAAAQTAQQARDAAEQARDIARAERDAAQARRDAAQAQRDAEQAGDKSGDAVVTIQLPDGKSITLNDPSPEAIASALGMPLPPPELPEESDGPYVIGALAIVCTAVVVLSAITMWYRTTMRRHAGPSQLPADLTQRMTRMENAIESVAVEVERISEGQRFTTRLLSDRALQEVPRG
jgi:hypothetical protein